MTKKIFLGMSAMAMLFATSCKDDFAESFVGDQATVEFSISTPEIGTRAYSDGTTATVLQYAVYDAAGEKLPLGGQKEIKGSTTVSLELTTGESYQVIFWAAADGAPYTVTFTDEIEDAKMEVSYANAKSNDEKRDAFYKYHEFTVSGAQTERIELRRPFAQLNIGTSDYTNAGKAGYTPTKSAVTVKNIYSTLNLASGAVSDDVEATFDYNAIPGKVTDVNAETFPVTGYEYLAMNYLLVPADQEVVDIEFGYTETDANAAKTRTVGSVPVQRNYRTNIYGKLLTSKVDVNVEIKPEYNEPAKELEELQNAALNGGEVTLTEDITLTTPLKVYGKMTINLNGKTINASYQENSTTNHIYAIENYSDLTIKNGTINARGNFNYGKLTIEENVIINAIDDNGGYGVRNYPGAEFVMNGGEIATTNDGNDAPGAGYDATTLRVDEGATATIKGGKINNICNYTFAVDNYGTTTIKGGEISSVHTTISNYGTMTINDGSFTCNGLQGITAHALVAWNGSSTTIEGGVFDGKDNYNGFNVDADNGATVNIRGGEFRQCHSGSLYGDGTIKVEGGKFFDKIADNRLADGYKAIEKDGKWIVVAAPNDAASLATAVEKGGVIVLDENITLNETIVIPTGVTATIDLNGKTVKAPSSSAFVAKEGAELTIKNGKVVAYESTVRALGGKIIVESGEYTSTGTALDSPATYRYSLDCREGGELVVNGGTFKSNNGMINVGSTVTINGGKFENIVEKNTTRHFAYVSAQLIINDGEFYGKANSGAGGCFFCGAASTGVVTVNGGKFTSLWTSGYKNNIWESYFGGSIEIKGGIFNHNGGIKDQVTENTDATTKDAYPYKAK